MEKLRGFAKSVWIITFIAFLTGCAETKDGRTTQAQGTALGALGGAAIGALIGYATGGGQGAAQGAIAGAAIGAVGGFAYGTHVAHQKAKYASTELWLDNCIASARNANRRAYAYNQRLSQRLANLEARSKSAMASRNKAAVGQIRTEIASLKKEAAQQSVAVNNEIEAQKGASDDQSARAAKNYGTYNKEMGDLRQTGANLSKNVNRLASLENQVNL